MHIDFLGPLTQTLNGNSYVGLAVCALTKYVEAAGKIANTKLTFLNIRIPLRFKPTTTPPGYPNDEQMMTHFFLRKVKETKCYIFPQKLTGNMNVKFAEFGKIVDCGFFK